MASHKISFAKRIGASLLFIIFANLFLFHYIGSVGVTFILFGIYSFVLFAFWKKGSVAHKKVITFISIALLIYEIEIVSRANGAISMLLVWSVLAAIFVSFYLLNNEQSHFSNFTEMAVSPLRMFFAYLSSATKAIQFPFSRQLQQEYLSLKLSKPSEKVARSLLGIILALPIVYLFVTMLSGADPIFGHYAKGSIDFIRDFFSNLFSERVGARITFSLFIFAVLFPLSFIEMQGRFLPKIESKISFGHEMSIVQYMVSGVFAIFLFVDAPYIFATVDKEVDLSKFGVATFSEYVNKGFGELVFISILVFALIAFGLFVLKSTEKSERKTLFIAQISMIGVFAIFVLSIFRRIYLYQLYHGWTLDRIYGGIFIFLIFALLTTLTARHFFERRWIMADIAIVAIFVIFLGIFNAEHFVVTHRLPTVNGRVDYLYLSRMSPDGYEGWLMAYDHAQGVIKKSYPGMNDAQYKEFIYAGLELSEFTKEFVRLKSTYGGEDRYEMYRSILDSLDNKYKSELLNIDKQYLANPDVNTNTFYIKTTNNLNAVENIISKFDNGDFDEEEFADNVGITDHYTFLPVVFNGQRSEIVSFYYYNNYYIPSSFSVVSQRDALGYNYSKYRAYRELNNRISIKELFSLQKEFIRIYELELQYHNYAFQMDTDPFSVFLTSI